MENNNIQIDIDEAIIEFVKSHCIDKIDIKKKVEEIVEAVLKEQNINANIVDVSIQSATEEEIKEINKKYRGVDKATDVLSFPIFTREEIKQMGSGSNLQLNTEIELGDIILCLNIIEKQSKEYATGLIREILYMITHGMCHLVGHDHEIEEVKVVMSALVEKVLKKAGVGNPHEK